MSCQPLKKEKGEKPIERKSWKFKWCHVYVWWLKMVWVWSNSFLFRSSFKTNPISWLLHLTHRCADLTSPPCQHCMWVRICMYHIHVYLLCRSMCIYVLVGAWSSFGRSLVSRYGCNSWVWNRTRFGWRAAGIETWSAGPTSSRLGNQGVAATWPRTTNSSWWLRLTDWVTEWMMTEYSTVQYSTTDH